MEGYEGFIKRKITKTFYDWCVENNRQDLLDRWDNQLNYTNPNCVSFCEHNEFYFKCPVGKHKSELKRISNITTKHNHGLCNQCNSFAQWGIDNICSDFIKKYWDEIKNIKSAYDYSKQSNKFVWIKCQEKDYHGSYYIRISHFVRGERCPYCSHQKVHSLDSLGTLYPESLKYWSSKNKKTPFQCSPHSGAQVFWICQNNIHEEYKRSIYSSCIYNFRCPECSSERKESFLQEKVRKYLESLGYEVLHEHNCTLIPKSPKEIKTNGTLPFDNEIIINGKHLIIEVHGEQHYKVRFYEYLKKDSILTPNQQLHKRKLYDRYKKYIAYANGYEYIAIPYWLDNKKESYKTVIDNKIHKIIVSMQ